MKRKSTNSAPPKSPAVKGGSPKPAKADLRARENRLQLILENARDFAILTTDRDGNVTSWSAGAQTVFGYEEGEIIGQNSRLLFPSEDQATAIPEAELRRAVAQGRASDDRWMQRRDGSRFFANGLTMPLREDGQSGTLLGFVKILRDDTKRHQAEQERQRAETRFRVLAESVQDYAIFLLDPTGTVTSWSKGAERVKGYSEDEALGASFSIFYPPEDLAAGEPERELTIANQEGRFEKETWRVRKDGTRYWASETIVRLGGESHELLGFAQICRDLSERRQADEERVRLLQAEQTAREVAETANAAKDRFLAALSHELRTPLTPIAMATYSLEREKDLSPAARMAVEMIQRNLQSETQLIDDLLDVSRSLHGKLDLRLVPTDAHQCLQSALEVIGPDFAAKNLRVTVSLRAARHRVSADPARLRQVFWNLLKNAAKFTGANGWVEVRSRNASPGTLRPRRSAFPPGVRTGGQGLRTSFPETGLDAFGDKRAWHAVRAHSSLRGDAPGMRPASDVVNRAGPAVRRVLLVSLDRQHRLVQPRHEGGGADRSARCVLDGRRPTAHGDHVHPGVSPGRGCLCPGHFGLIKSRRLARG